MNSNVIYNYRNFKRAVLLMLSSTIILTASAITPDAKEAKQRAIDFFTSTAVQNGSQKVKAASVSVVQRYQSDDAAKSPVFVYERSNGGFVVVVQTEAGSKVLGYSPSAKFQADNQPPQLLALLKNYEQTQGSATEIAKVSVSSQAVAPMLDAAGVQLNQFTHENVGGCPSGCVATAIAQIMAFYKYPAKGIGSHCFQTPSYGTLCADFGNTTYNWNNPTFDDYKLLSFQVGVAMDMNYCGVKGGSAPSAANYYNVPRDYFGYYVQNGSTNSEYLRTEIDNGRPVYIEIPGDPGHAVVLDGYADDGAFHINFGWGGQANGYYQLNTNTTMNVGGTFGTNISHAQYISLKPYVTSVDDSLALVALHNGLNGTTGWNLTKPVIEWGGVMVINKRVVELTLDRAGLTGEISNQIGNLSALCKLSISGNLNGTLPTSIFNLTHLNYLLISKGAGDLTGSLPASIGNLTQLQYLSLYNILEGILPTSIGQLTNLRMLFLPNGKLSGSIPSEITNLKQLTEINLSNHNLNGILPADLGTLSNLMILDVSNNKLSGSLPASLGRLSNLTLFSVKNNQLTGEIPDSLQRWTKVVRFELSNNQFSGTLPPSIANLASLTYLDVSQNKLTALPTEIGNLSKLQTLAVSDNLLTSLPESLNNLVSLRTLSAKNNKIATLAENFGAFKVISDVDLSNNQLTVFPEGLCYPATLYSLVLSNNKISKFPAAIDYISSKLDVLRLDNNELSGTIPVSLLTSRMSLFFIENNYFRFEDIPVSAKTFYQSVGSQKTIPLTKNKILVAMGDTVKLDIHSVSTFTNKGNTYYWCQYPKYLTQGGGYLSNVTPDSVLKVVITEKTIHNKYYCKVFNPTSPSWSYVFNDYTYINPCLNGLNTDTIGFQLATEEQLLAEKYPDSHVFVSKNILKKEVDDKIVTLVPSAYTRGTLKWQASADGKVWHALSATMSQADLKSNFITIATDKLVLSPKTPAYYRTELTESSCNPIYSDTIKVNPFGKVIFDQQLNVATTARTITADSIEVTIPAGICKDVFRLTIVKLDNPPSAPDTVKLGSVYDVTVSFGSIFNEPLLIKMKNIPKGINEKNIDKYQAVYFDDKNQQWVKYDNGHLSLKDSTLLFETNHLTKLSWWYNDEAVWGYTDVFVRDNVRVLWTDTDENYFNFIYGKQQTPQTWHEAGTPVMIQDIAHYLGEVLAKLKALKLAVPDHAMTVYVKEMDDDGVVGLLGMLNNYLSINRDIEGPVALRSLLAHEYMHYLQDKYITASPGNIFWMEANAHLTDRMVWDETVIPVSQSDDYLLDGRKAKNSIFNFLSNSWDYWDSSTLTQNAFGNIHYCYQAGTFIHFMRSYREGEKLKPETLLKETTYLGSWRTYLSNYITANLKSNIGNEYENYIKYILDYNPNFTLLNTENGNPYSYIIKGITDGGSDGFGQSVIYNFAPEVKEPQVNKMEMTVPYLATKMILLTNQTPDRATIVSYKRMHSANKDKKVYIGRFDFKTKKIILVDITDSTKYSLMLEPRTEKVSEETRNISFILLINKKSPTTLETGSDFDASFELTALPVQNITDLKYLCVSDGFIHTYSNGSNYPFFIEGVRNSINLPNLTYFAVNGYSSSKTILNDSTYSVHVTFSDEFHMSNGPGLPASMKVRELTQDIEYNFVLGLIDIVQYTKSTFKFGAYHDNFFDKDVPERLSSISNQTTKLKLIGVNAFSLATDGELYFTTNNPSATKTNADTRAAILLMTDEQTDSNYNEKGEVSSTNKCNYVETDYNRGPVPILLWVHYK